MKRAAAVFTALAIVSANVGPARAIDYHPPFDPVVTIGGETRLTYPDFPVELLANEAETGGQFGLVVQYSKPGEGPTNGMLIEQKLTETFYVLEGQFRFDIGDQIVEGGSGTVVVNPPGVPHGFFNSGTTVGRLLTLYTPSDGTRGTGFFTSWAEQSTRSPEWIAKTNAEYGIDRPAP